MTRNRAGILYGIAFIVWAAVMAAWHFVLTGISVEFGAGAAVGVAVGIGLMALCSRSVREMD